MRSLQSYDALGLVTALSQQVGSNAERAVQNIIYNLAGGMTQETLPSGRVVVYGYDGAGRVSSAGTLSNQNQYASGIAYSAAGALQNLPMGNGVNESTGFNSRLQPVSIAAVSAGNAALQLNLYYCGSHQIDCAGNNGNLQEQDIQDSTGLSGTAVQSYYYDTLNRLCGALEASTPGGAFNCTSGLSGNYWQQNYVYDAFGNRALLAGGYGTTGNTQAQVSGISASAVAGIFPNNRWSGAAPDLGGNVRTLYASGPQAAYDAENRVSSVTESTMPGISYLYDGEGRRVLKTVGSTTTEYVYGAAGELVAEYGGSAPAVNTTLYLTADHLGSTRMVTDTHGNVTELRDYAPFGEELGQGVGPRSALYAGLAYPSVTTDANDVNFTGKGRDAESGLDFFGARYFSSAQGRFTSPDALLNSGNPLNPQSWNRYSYVFNNPLRYTDPTGLYTCSGTKEECSGFANSLKDLQSARNSYKKGSDAYNSLNSALSAYGKAGVDNGVRVGFGATSDGAPAATNIGVNSDAQGNKVVTADNPTGQNITVTIDPSQNGSRALEAVNVGHEGVHVAEGTALVGALPMSLLGTGAQGVLGGPLNLTKYQTETDAYRATGWAAQALFPQQVFSVGNGHQLWNPSWAAADVQTIRSQGIRDELADPKGPYNVTPAIPGSKLIQ